MAESGSSKTSAQPSLSDLLGLISGGQIAGIGATIDQFRRAADQLMGTVESLTATMRTLDTVANRALALLDELERPVRAITPALTRSSHLAATAIDQINAPLERVGPALGHLVSTLTSMIGSDSASPTTAATTAPPASPQDEEPFDMPPPTSATTKARPAARSRATKAVTTAPAKPSKKRPAKKG